MPGVAEQPPSGTVGLGVAALTAARLHGSDAHSKPVLFGEPPVAELAES